MEPDCTNPPLFFRRGISFRTGKNPPPIDIIFMDIYLGGINGIEAARDISRTGRGRFIFTTASREYALEAFALNAVHYLLKPLTKNAVREALGRCLPKREDEHPKLLEIKTRQGIVPIPMDNIVYIEVLSKIFLVAAALLLAASLLFSLAGAFLASILPRGPFLRQMVNCLFALVLLLCFFWYLYTVKDL